MIDFSIIEQYRENNRLEAKKAVGGLPRSVWETYSAFANTLGGVILLGVEENMEDHSLHLVDIPDPEEQIRQFWRIVNDPRYVSVNILSEDHVQMRLVDGKAIIVITVPQAGREERPVYIGEDPMSGTYCRSGEGDYKCTRLEVERMLREAQRKT